MMKNLLLSSLVVLFFISGCTLGHYGRLHKAPTPSATPKSIFGDNFNSFLFKANITLYKKEISGLLLAKQMAPHDYRIIFTTELGMKLFDFEFKDSTFTVHYSVPQFALPALLQTIQQDIQILLMNNISEKKMESLYYCDEGGISCLDVQKTKSEKMYNYYFTDRASHQIVKIEHSKKRTKKVLFSLNDYKDHFPNNIIIRHYNIKLKIELNLLKK